MLRKLTIINKQCQFWRLANVIQHAFQHAFLRYDRPHHLAKYRSIRDCFQRMEVIGNKLHSTEFLCKV